MEEIEKIALLSNEVEANIMEELLEERNIPHLMRSYHDSAYDGLYQQGSWGHIEAPAGYKDVILSLLDEVRNAPEESDQE